MGTNEKLVPGELLTMKIMRPYKYWVKQNFKNNIQAIKSCLKNNTNEEITHV